MSIDVRPFEAAVPLGFANSQPGVFRIGLKDVGDLESVVLEDTKENIFTDLLLGDYTFSWDDSDDASRFVLHLSITGIAAYEAADEVSMFTSYRQLFLQASSGKTVSGVLTVTDLAGRQILVRQLDLNGSSSISLPVASGVYIVRFGSEKSLTVQKILINYSCSIL